MPRKDLDGTSGQICQADFRVSGKDIADTFEEEFAAKLNMSSPCAVDEHSVTSLAECQTMWKPSSNILGIDHSGDGRAVGPTGGLGPCLVLLCGKFAFPAWSSTGCKTCSSNSNSPAWSDLESQCVCNEGACLRPEELPGGQTKVKSLAQQWLLMATLLS